MPCFFFRLVRSSPHHINCCKRIICKFGGREEINGTKMITKKKGNSVTFGFHNWKSTVDEGCFEERAEVRVTFHPGDNFGERV